MASDMTHSAPLYKVTRNEDHSYVITTDKGTRLVPGVTTIKGEIGKPWLAGATAKSLCMALGAMAGPVGSKKPSWKNAVYLPDGLWKAGVAYTKDQIVQIIDTARKGFGKKSDEAKDTGTRAHEWIEAAISAEVMGIPVPKYPDDPEAAMACQSWYTWRQAHEVEWYSAESIVASIKYGYGGTFDARGRVKGPVTGGVWKKFMGDWKTSKDMYDDYWLQFHAYLEAYREMTGDTDDYTLVGMRIPKDGKPAEWVEAPDWATRDLCLSAFLGLRAVYDFSRAADAAKEGY